MKVIDASVAIKWFIHEPGSDAAVRLLKDPAGSLVLPDIALAEIGGALVRRANADKQLRVEVDTSLARLAAYVETAILIPTRTSAGEIEVAGRLALDIGHPLKDCLYLELAMRLDLPLLTFDAKFVTKAKLRWSRIEIPG